MLESLDLLYEGMKIALQPSNIIFAFIGCALGTAVGVLPGIGPVAGTAILLPISFALGPIPSIIMLAAIYYGAMYGGTITSVLINVPGEAASAVTCIDGYQMAKNGRAGAALTVAAVGSFIGGTVSIVGLVLLAIPMASLGLKFGPPEFFALLVLGLSLVVSMAGNSIRKTVISAGIGLVIAMVGLDPVAGDQRLTFGVIQLYDGISIAALAMGIFGVGEVLQNLERSSRQAEPMKVTSLRMTRQEVKSSVMPVVRGTGFGFVMGLIPGLGSLVPTVTSYMTERNMSKTPERFGNGAIEGVAGPETANNAHANAALIPLFTLGIPGSPTVAVLMGAFIMHGLQPGPFLFTDHPDIAWSVIASLYVGNIILLILNLPLIPMWVKIVKIPPAVLNTCILAFCIIGSYSFKGSTIDIWVVLGAGILGYVMRKLDYPVAPLVLTAVLAGLIEQSLRQSLEISNGDFMIFVTHPISAVLLLISALVFVLSTRSVMKNVQGANSET